MYFQVKDIYNDEHTINKSSVSRLYEERIYLNSTEGWEESFYLELSNGVKITLQDFVYDGLTEYLKPKIF